MARRHERAPALIRAFWGGGEHLERPRVVLVHPGALPVTSYVELAAALLPGVELFVIDLEQVPEYACAAAASGGGAQVTVGRLAAQLDDALWERGLLTPPWLLAGWAFGGVVGHALTATLSDDEQPEGLFLLDTIAPVPDHTAGFGMLDAGLLLTWFAMYLGARRGAPVPVPVPTPAPGRRLADANADAGLRLVLDSAIEHGALPPGTPLAGLRKAFDTYTRGLLRDRRLAAAHSLVPAPVPVCLIRPECSLLGTSDPLDPFGWRTLAPDLTQRRCPGDHYSMVRGAAAARSIAAAARESLIGSRMAS